MTIVGLVGSMRSDGATDRLVRAVLASAQIENPSLQPVLFHAADLRFEPCRACYGKCGVQPFECVLEDDLARVLAAMAAADAVVIGSPLYFKIPSALTAFMERLSLLAFYNDVRGHRAPSPLLGKPCGLVGVAAEGDPQQVLEHLFRFALTMRMEPLYLKAFPFYGVAARTGDEGPLAAALETAAILGRMLGEAARDER